MFNKNNISIKKYLEEKGIVPKIEKSHYGLYHSPFRKDSTPSFKIDFRKNLWIDYGTGEGGSIVDLIMKFEKCPLGEAMRKAESMNIDSSFSFHGEEKELEVNSSKTIEIVELKEIQNKSLIRYLSGRKISLSTANKFCKEIHYTVRSKKYFGIGFPNDKGGFEIRNPYFKGGDLKSISTIKGKDDYPVYVFEGFFDFLSFIEIEVRKKVSIIVLESNFIILNSVSLIKDAISELKNYQEIHLFLDNDSAGKSACSQIKNAYPNAIDCSIIYENFKDLNDFLIFGKF